MKYASARSGKSSRRRSPRPVVRKVTLCCLLLLCCSGLAVGLAPLLTHGQFGESAFAQSSNVQRQEDRVIREFTLPNPPPQAPVYQPQPEPAPVPFEGAAPVESTPSDPAPATPSAPSAPGDSVAAQPEKKPNAPKLPSYDYVMEFSRSPIVGNRLRLEGVYDESRIGFTRPRNWKLLGAKALIRYQHSPALLASRSNLIVRVNGTSVGSVPLNRKQSQIGEVLVTIPPSLIQDNNEISVAVQQNTDPKCSNSSDPALWTEVLPDSKLVFKFEPQPILLDFSRFPYPFFDTLSLDPNRLAYVPPAQVNQTWLTNVSRFHAMMGRLADFRPLETRLVKGTGELKWNDRLVIIGTPSEQPILKSLKLPFTITDNQVLDGKRTALPGDVGVLMLTSIPGKGMPVLVATGNGPEGVAKAVQFLVQPQNRQIGTGQALLVNDLTEVPSPNPRAWSRHLPLQNSFKLSDLTTRDNQPFKDVTVRGAGAPTVEIDFRALPDDRFIRGNTMTLVYSHGPQVNPRTSSVDVAIDGVGIGGKQLTSEKGATRETLNISLPENLITPTSKIQVFFRLDSKDPALCGLVNDQQLWGTVHSDTSFNLNRENSVNLPDLKLLHVGYPFAAPQDLSNTAITLPDAPSNTDLLTLLQFSERIGRLSQAESVKLNVYTTGTLPPEVRDEQNLVGIGTRDRFPLPETLQAEASTGTFALGNFFSRQSSQGQIQTLPDTGGVIQQTISPWNRNRVVLALTSQTENGLKAVQDVLSRDSWFYQLKGDTVLINPNRQGVSASDPNAYEFEFLQRTPQKRIENTSLLSKATRFLQENWFFLPTGIVFVSLVLYGISQLYLKRLAGGTK